MKKFLISTAVAILGWVALSTQASAATIQIDPNPVAIFGDAFGKKKTFSNAYEFTFEGIADGTFGALAAGMKYITSAICADATCSGGPLISGSTSSGPFGLLSVTGGTFTGLTGGTYFLVIAGKTSKWLGGAYLGALSLSVTPTVPIPPALLLFATALGGLGVMKRFGRKRPTA